MSLSNKEVSYTIFPTLQEMSLHPLASQLDGSNGTNRETEMRCEINAANDFEAIQIWLKEYSAKEATHRLYQKESERLLLWCIFYLGKALSSITREDLEQYFMFLRNPQPREIWCGQRGGKGRKRGDTKWRPFEGKLGESSIATTITVITSLLNYLEEARYLQFNPIRLIRKKLKSQQFKFEEQKLKLQQRILEPDEWHAMQLSLANWPDKTSHEKEEKERLKLIVAMLFLLGLRVNELATHNWNYFRNIQGNCPLCQDSCRLHLKTNRRLKETTNGTFTNRSEKSNHGTGIVTWQQSYS